MTINEKKEIIYKMIKYSIEQNPTNFNNGVKTLEFFSLSEAFSSPHYVVFNIISYYLLESKKGKKDEAIVNALEQKHRTSSTPVDGDLNNYIKRRLQQEFGSQICNCLMPLIDDFIDMIEEETLKTQKIQ